LSDLDVRIELEKLGHELATDAADLEFLASLTPEELTRLRHLVTEAIFSAHEHRFGRLAKASKLVPPTIAAKAAQTALSPLVAARVSAVIDPQHAVRMSGHFDPAYLAELTPHLDPTRAGAMIRGLPEELLVDVGRRMVQAEEYVALGRLVALIPAEASRRVVEDATGLQLLRIARYAEDHAALEAVLAGMPDARLGEVLRAAEDAGEGEAATALLDALSPEVIARARRGAEDPGLSS
jgi:hypothetical protein